MEKTVNVPRHVLLRPLLVLLWKLLVCCNLVVRAGATSIWVSHEHCKAVDLEIFLCFCPTGKRTKRENNSSSSPSESPCLTPGSLELWSLLARRRSSQASRDHVEGVQSICASSCLGWQRGQKIRDNTEFLSCSNRLCPSPSSDFGVPITTFLPDP